MSSSLLVLGGGPFSLPLLRWAREAGLETNLVDADPRASARRAAQTFQTIPRDDANAHAALARRLQADAKARGGSLAGVVATEERYLPLLPALAEVGPGALPRRAALERVLSASRARLGGESGRLELFAFFRDGAFVPCGFARHRRLENGDALCLQPSELEPAAARAACVQVERAARAAGLEQGLLQAELVEEGSGLAVAALLPTFLDLVGAAHVARLAYGKSPLQAWFAHLAGAGGPFDEPAPAPRGAAGWLAIAPPSEGIFAGIDHATRARTLPGIADLWVDEPGRTLAGPLAPRPLAYVWAGGETASVVEARLRAARATLDVRVAEVVRLA